MPRLSANLGFLWPDRPLIDRIGAAARAGFTAVEIHWPYDYDEAFDALTQALLAFRIAVRLRPGQSILIDNKRIVHSRSQFRAN